MMSTRETHRNLDDIVTAAASECAKAGGPVIVPWRLGADQAPLRNGLEDCGCGFAPDDDGRNK